MDFLKKQFSNSAQGMIFMLLAAFFFSVSGATTKVLGKHLNSVELVFFRNIIGVIFVLISILKKPLKNRGGKFALLAFRGVIGTLALFTFFYAITKIGLAEAITYQQSYPVFLAAIGIFLLNETPRPVVWWAIVIGFSGIFLIFFPQFNHGIHSVRFHILGISNAIMTALAYMSIKQLAAYYDSRAIVLSFMLSGIIIPLISFITANYFNFSGLDFLIARFVIPQSSDLFWILLLAFSALFGQLALTKAFSIGDSGEVSAIGYFNILFSVWFGVILGDQFPKFLGFMGMLLIILSGLIISRKKNMV